MTNFSPSQLDLIDLPLDSMIFLEGPAGCGKTTAAVERMLAMMARGIPARDILLIVPQRTLATPYYAALEVPGAVAGGLVTILTVGGLAQRMVDTFWPQVAGKAGFAKPDQPPIFLTLETAQYYMSRLVQPLLEQGYFESLSINRNRLFNQILDNLNKSALVGFSVTEISQRLKSSWIGESSQARLYDDAQDCAIRFREYCLTHNLLDFSLQIEVFWKHLWADPLCRNYLKETYHHLIVDNLEEDTPLAHDLLREWLPDFSSALLIYDQEAGYRTFLGADPLSAYQLRDICTQRIAFTQSFATSPAIQSFEASLKQSLTYPPTPSIYTGQKTLREKRGSASLSEAIAFEYHRYYPQMIDWVTTQICLLVREEQIPPGKIAVLAPFMTDALRFSLLNRLEREGIPARSHRPSRALREEPATQCLLTLAALSHPDWGIQPTRFDMAYALMQAIQGMDLVRSQLLVEIVYRLREGVPTLSSFERIKPDVQERITFTLGQRYETLRKWIESYRQSPGEELDFFLSRLFGEVLSQPGYTFHQDFTAGEVAANLVESARKFRWAVAGNLPDNGKPLGQEYIEMVQDGVVAAQYILSWQAQPEQAVLLAPAYTFLTSNRAVDYQFWLDIASRGWFERLYQPLTHPYVLSRHWPENKTWTDADEVEANQEALYRLALGLVRRCRQKIYLGLSELSEQGFEFQGPLLKAIQRVLKENQ